jgi:hypothetical protein
VLRRIFGPKRDEVTEEWRTRSFMICIPHQIHSGDKCKKTEMYRVCSTYGRGEGRSAYRVLVGKPEGRALGRPRRRWEDNIEMDIRAVVWGRHGLGR